MFIEESVWIREKLAALNLRPGGILLNVGSSTADFLKTQPHISENILDPIKALGLSIKNLDLKKDPGVDVEGDIGDPELIKRLRDKFTVVLCSNLLEHVRDHKAAIKNLTELTGPGGYLLVTVPRKYPRHDDPIDTLYRPSPEDLTGEISKYAEVDILAADTLDIRSSIYYFYESRLPFWGYRKFRFWRYLFKPFRWKAACVLCRVKSARSGAAATT
jgi:SAM-dependent methyltransferase